VCGRCLAVAFLPRRCPTTRCRSSRSPHILRREVYGIPATVGGVLMRYVPPRIADMLVEPARRASVPDFSYKGRPDPGKGLTRG
jgi:hypothetical protein